MKPEAEIRRKIFSLQINSIKENGNVGFELEYETARGRKAARKLWNVKALYSAAANALWDAIKAHAMEKINPFSRKAP